MRIVEFAGPVPPPGDGFDRRLRQRVAAILESAGNFGHAVGAGRNLVFELDGALDVPVVVPDQAQDFRDRRVALAERRVGAFMHLSVLQMHMGDALVIFLDERHRGRVVAGDEVTKVHVRPVVFREGKRVDPMLGLHGGVAMIPHHELVLVGKLPDPFEVVILGGNLAGDGPSAQRLGQGEDVIQLVIRHLEQPIHLHDFNQHPRCFSILSEIPSPGPSRPTLRHCASFWASASVVFAADQFGRHAEKRLHRLGS